MEEEASSGYSWEGALERSWDVIEEDDSGNLKIGQAVTKQQRQRRLEIARNVRKGLIRYTYVVMDLSRGMATKDWKPHRLACASEVLQQFVKDYFDQNPISQLGVIGIKGMMAEKLSDLSGNPKTHIERIAAALAVDKEPSLQNALEIARSSLKTVPAYGSREVVVVYGNLVTADPGDIFQTLASLKRENIRVSFIGIGAEMHLLRRIADGTDGTYNVAVDADHMKRLMTAFTFPSPTVATAASRFATLVEMGFPQRRSGALSLCTCHQAFTTVGYLCPRCKSKSCDLPTTCQVCNLPLVSSPHLARSYHHLFPVAKFTQHLLRSGVTGEKGAKVSPELVQKKCFGCLLPLGLDGEGAAYECTTCQSIFCSECDIDEELGIESSVVHPEPEQQEIDEAPVEIAFSASAGMFVYQMGVAAFIQAHFDLSNCHFSGCSGGSWAATLLASETPVRQAWQVIKETQAKVITSPKWYSGYGRYATIMKQTLHELWRDDKGIHKRVEQRHLTIAVTKFPSMTAEKHTSWQSLDDLTGSIMASSLVPFALSSKPCISHRGQWYIDGAFTNFKGVNCDEYSTWADLSFHTAQTVLDYARSTSTALVGYLLPGAWGKNVANKLFNLMPILTSPHDTIAPSSISSGQMKRLIIKPWNWRSQSMCAFHLSVDLATHEERFALGYQDAQQHCQELAAVLPLKNATTTY